MRGCIIGDVLPEILLVQLYITSWLVTTSHLQTFLSNSTTLFGHLTMDQVILISYRTRCASVYPWIAEMKWLIASNLPSKPGSSATNMWGRWLKVWIKVHPRPTKKDYALLNFWLKTNKKQSSAPEPVLVKDIAHKIHCFAIYNKRTKQ